MGVDVSFLDPSPSEFPSGWFSARGRVKMSSNIFRRGGQCGAYTYSVIMTVAGICMTKSDNENAYIMCTYFMGGGDYLSSIAVTGLRSRF